MLDGGKGASDKVTAEVVGIELEAIDALLLAMMGGREQRTEEKRRGN